MKRTHSKILVLVFVVLLCGIAGYFFLRATKTQTAKFHAAKFFTAISNYRSAMEARNLKLPQTIPMQELIAKGFLKHEDVSAWDGWDVTVLVTTNEIYPESALMKARDRDGNQLVLLADGSVQFKN